MAKKEINVAIVGATGLVGRKMLQVLEERNFPVSNLKLLASARTAGTILEFKGKELTVQELKNDSFDNVDIALFSAGKKVSVEFAPIAASKGCIVIDNGSHWRMNPNVPLVVPEVNPEALKQHYGIIANPNCSTIQLVVALKPIQDRYKLKRVVVSTYQSISGAGQKGVSQLLSEIKGEIPSKRVSSHKIAFNLVFHDLSDSSGFSEEEIKMKNEIRKIMSLPDLPVAVTCVRLPILGGHGESVNIETENPISIEELRDLLNQQDGIKVIDEPQKDKYPTPELSNNTDHVYIGRIRKDDSVKNGTYLWIVSDNVRKGAATNAVQIAELLIKEDLFKFDSHNFI
jgi:aspartate-semialdehyde dehydrogenase